MKTKFGTFILLGGLSMAASAQIPTAVPDIYSSTDFSKTEEGISVVANAFAWHNGGITSELSALPALMASLNPETIPTLVEGIGQDIDGIHVGWNSAEKLLTVDCPADRLGRLEVRVFNLNGVQLASETLAESTTTVSLTKFVPDYYLVALTEDGKLVKTIKLNLK